MTTQAVPKGLTPPVGDAPTLTTKVRGNQSSRRRRRNDLFMHAFLLFVGLLVCAPVIIAILTSFKVPSDVFNFPPQLIPETWTLQNYATAWNSTPLGRMLFNSFVQTGIITLFSVAFSIPAAYAFAMMRFPGRDFLFYLVVGSLMIPFELVFIPNFLLVSGWGWTNTFQGLTVPFLASAFGIFLLRQFFMALPQDLHDAAKVDGASNLRFMWQILIPLSRGAIGAFAIFAFLSAWNQFLWPLIITDSETMRTTQIGIRFFLFDQERGSDWGAIMAAAVIVMIPTLVAFLVAQKQLVRGIAMSGLKG